MCGLALLSRSSLEAHQLLPRIFSSFLPSGSAQMFQPSDRSADSGRVFAKLG